MKTSKVEHYPVDRCMTMHLLGGFLCNCGRTILGQINCWYHFDKSIDELEQELKERKNEPA